MLRRKIPIVVFLLITVGLLLGTSVPIMGAEIESIPYSDTELSKRSVDKFQLENTKGVHIFDLDKGKDFDSTGYITLSNTYSESISVSLEVVTHLSTVDLDSKGSPRIHPTISNTIYFREYPKLWIKLEYTEITVEANSWCRVPYTIYIPYEQVWKEIDNNVTNGFLGYINIKKSEVKQLGMSIGISYNYKVFSLFSGEYQESTMSFYFFVGIIAIIGGLVLHLIYYKIEKRKRLSN